MWAPLPPASVFFRSQAIFVILVMSHSTACLLCLCLSSVTWRAWALGLVLSSHFFSQAWTLPWQKPLSIQPVQLLLLLLLFLPCPWVYWMSFLPCWPIRLITSFLGPPQPITFTSCYAYEPVGCYSYYVGSLGLLPLSLSFFEPFTFLLLLDVPMSLLAVILAMLAYWAKNLFPWASTTHLFYFYLLLCIWTC